LWDLHLEKHGGVKQGILVRYGLIRSKERKRK